MSRRSFAIGPVAGVETRRQQSSQHKPQGPPPTFHCIPSETLINGGRFPLLSVPTLRRHCHCLKAMRLAVAINLPTIMRPTLPCSK